MGYTTDFEGIFKINKPLPGNQAAYLLAFSEKKRVKRDGDIALNLLDPMRARVGLPIGDEGGYYVGGVGSFGQDNDTSVMDHNTPPSGQPSLWCQWVPTQDVDGNYTQIEWDSGEKFYHYVAWIEYLIEHFLEPWGYTLNGEVLWFGEDRDDIGTITITDNAVSVEEGSTHTKPLCDPDGNLYIEGVVDNVRIALEEMDGDDIATAHNSICAKKIAYDEDSVWKYTGEDDND